MKKLFTCLFLMGIILFQINSANAEVKKDAGFISLNASKSKEVEPNRARISFAVESIENEAQVAVSKNNEISNKIIKALKELTTIETDTIKTNNFSVRPNYAKALNGTRTIRNYTAINSVIVETKDITKVAKLIDTAIANGANRTDNLSYSFEGEKNECLSLYPLIMKELNEQASILATSSGSILDGIKHINASCNMDMPVSNGRFYAKNAMADGAIAETVSTPIEAGKVKVRVYVNAEYYVK